MHKLLSTSVVLAATCSSLAIADTCDRLPNHATLQNMLRAVVPAAGKPNGGLGFPMWATVVDGSGRVCTIATSLVGGDVTADIWLGSRIISAQKANTANAFSTSAFSLSTANLYSAVQPGGSLFGLQESNPVDATVAYNGLAAAFGTGADPLMGNRIGGINVFGGGLALYSGGKKVGGLGVSGDTSCTDHVVAYKVRALLMLASVPNGVAPITTTQGNDRMLQDITPNPAGGSGVSQGGFGHPECLNNPTSLYDGGSIVHSH